MGIKNVLMILSPMILSISIATAEPLQLAGTAMGTTYSVRIADWPENKQAAALHKQIERLLDKIDLIFSTYREDSEISRLHRSASSEWLPISPELFEVLRLSREVQTHSHGTFDVTISPLVKLWKEASQRTPPQLPTGMEINNAVQSFGLNKWNLRDKPPALLKHHANLRFDVNGIVPGYAVDQLAKLLEKASLDNYLIEIGGEVRAKGNNWSIGIEAPTADANRNVLFSLPIRDSAVATSGDYRQGFEIEGKRYSHIIDPRTGWPIEQKQSSVTVVMDSCAEADAWATALFVHDPEAGIILADERQIAACFVVHDHKIIASQAFHTRFPQVDSPQRSLLHHIWLQFSAIITGAGTVGIFWFICFYLPHWNSRRKTYSGKTRFKSLL